jgi:uncharacterized protein (DUF2249 family)
MSAVLAPATPISDEHSVLLWQTCAYADDLSDAAGSQGRLTPAYDGMLQFLHYRLLPYLTNEERQIAPARLRDDHMLRLLVSDHERLRADVTNIESSRTRRLLTMAATALVDRLDRHVRREESWLTDPLGDAKQADVPDWTPPLLFGDVIDLDALPAEHHEGLLRQRLAWLRPGESVRVQAGSDPHSLWQRQHVTARNAHVWVYEEDGPTHWQARITRRDADDC